MTEIESILRTIGAIAVIAGTILVVLQLRVNAKHARSRNAFDLTAKVIDLVSASTASAVRGSGEARRRQLDWLRPQSAGLRGEELREHLRATRPPRPKRRGRPSGRAGRPLGSTHGRLAHLPADTKHIMQESGKAFPALAGNQPGQEAIFWPNFGWLAEESRKWTPQRASAAAGPGPPTSRTSENRPDDRGRQVTESVFSRPENGAQQALRASSPVPTPAIRFALEAYRGFGLGRSLLLRRLGRRWWPPTYSPLASFDTRGIRCLYPFRTPVTTMYRRSMLIPSPSRCFSKTAVIVSSSSRRRSTSSEFQSTCDGP